MMDHALEEALLARFKDWPILAESNFYLGHDNAEHKLPALTVVSNSEPLASSDRVFRSEVEITIESEAHDTSGTVHSERVEAVRIVLSKRAEFGRQALSADVLTETSEGGLFHSGFSHLNPESFLMVEIVPFSDLDSPQHSRA